MPLNEDLKDRLLEIKKQQEMYDDIISKFRKSIDSTCADQMEWVRRMNFARHYAEELVLAEYVYPEGVEQE